MKRDNQTKIFNPKHTKGQRRSLRNNMTQAEIKLWSALKGRQLLGIKFRRQHGIRNYIIDFYCLALNLAIEVDGESHYFKSGIRHDLKRDDFLSNLGIETLRFTNDQVFNNLDGVLKAIEIKIIELKDEI